MIIKPTPVDGRIGGAPVWLHPGCPWTTMGAQGIAIWGFPGEAMDYHGTVKPWYHGTMVPWYHDFMVTWYHGSMVPWNHGNMVPWAPGGAPPPGGGSHCHPAVAMQRGPGSCCTAGGRGGPCPPAIGLRGGSGSFWGPFLWFLSEGTNFTQGELRF